MRPIKWSDNDKYLGPFTLSRNGSYRHTGIILGSGDGDEYAGCRIRISLFGWTLISALPPIIKPWRRWVDTSRYDWSSPNGGYWDTGAREYGFTLSDGHLSVALGRVTMDSATEQRWGCFLPWTQWRHVRRSHYGLTGKHLWTEPECRAFDGDAWAVLDAARNAVPAAVFAFKDFDGEELTARTTIEEREWQFGVGWFKWLSLFRKPKISRDLEIAFSGETGKRKGSWKGGTIGHSITMLPGELHESAFRRYCAEHDMTFVAAVDRDALREEGRCDD